MKNLIFIFLVIFITSCSTTPKSQNVNSHEKSMQRSKSIVVIGHRGACGYRPEHTLASYELAMDMGADFIEPDLVLTKDGVFIARHENEISTTTDVAKKFPKRKKNKSIDGVQVTGWFTEDFTLAEIKKLKAKERLDFRSHQYDFQFDVPTFEEIIQLVKRKEQQLNRTIGIYPELKHSTYFASIGLKLEDRFLDIINKYGYNQSTSPIIVQSFEVSNLKYLHSKSSVRLMQLIGEPSERPYDFAVSGSYRTYYDMVQPDNMHEIAEYATIVGPEKHYILPVDRNNNLVPATAFINAAHAAGLLVHAYTFRNEDRYIANDFAKDPSRELKAYFDLGIDGIFSDFPDVAVRARESDHANTYENK